MSTRPWPRVDNNVSNRGPTTATAVDAQLEASQHRVQLALSSAVAVMGTLILAGRSLQSETLVILDARTTAWLAAATVAAGLGAVFHRSAVFRLLIAITTVCAINAAIFRSLSTAVAAEPPLMIILLWAGALLRPHSLTFLGAYAVVLIAALAESLVLIRPQHAAPGTFSSPLVVLAVAVPLAFVWLTSARDRWVRARLHRAINSLRAREKALAGDLRRKASELQASQEQLVQAQKLKTVGTMAAGLSHELNNILTPIRGWAEMLVAGTDLGKSRIYGQRILQSANAAASVTSALLTYTRQGSFHPQPSNPKELLLSNVLPVLNNSIPAGIRIDTRLADDISVPVDRVLFQQCVTNLVLNAVDAMPEGGRIVIDLRPGTCSRTDRDQPALPACLVTVSDSGLGITKDARARIFDPFFTTKAVGTGSGLGLPIVQGIVSRHGGEVRVRSAPGKGTAMTLAFPLQPGEIRSAAETTGSRDHRAVPVVVVIDSDQDLLDELEEILVNSNTLPFAPRISQERRT